MNLRDYYRSEFRRDVKRINLEPIKYPTNQGDVGFDVEAWKNSAAEIEDGDRRICFALSMFITVVSDQIMFKYFNDNYEKFRSLTLYPKFHSLMRPNGHYPYVLFQSLIEDGSLKEKDFTEDNVVAGADLFIDEILNFFHEHQKEVKGNEVLRKFIEDPDISSCKLLEKFNDKIRRYLDCKSGTLLLRLLGAGGKNDKHTEKNTEKKK
jgi:hypothetical protein